MAEVGKLEKLMLQVLSGGSDANIAFDDLRRQVVHTGFDERTRGNHAIFTRADVAQILNLQDKQGQARP